MSRKLFCSSGFVMLVILLTCLISFDAAAQIDGRILKIAQARVLPFDTEVTVNGTISTPPGAFNSSFSDRGFGLQDSSAGIFVSSQVEIKDKLGDKVRVTGVLKDKGHGLLVLVPTTSSDIIIDGHGRPVEAELVSTHAIGETTEGRIVQVVGKIIERVTTDLPYDYKFFVNDGSGPIKIFVNLETGIDVSYLTPGQTLSITGFSAQFDSHYEINPRSPKDIKVQHQ